MDCSLFKLSATGGIFRTLILFYMTLLPESIYFDLTLLMFSQKSIIT